MNDAVKTTLAAVLIFILFAGGCAAPSAVSRKKSVVRQKVISPSGTSIDSSRKISAGRLSDQALEVAVLLKEHRSDQAVLALVKAREITQRSPRDPYAWVLLGLAGAASGSRTDAEEGFSEALLIDPENIHALLGLGDIALAKGDAEYAKKLYKMPYEMTVDPLAANRLAHLEISDGHYDAAYSILSKAFDKHNDNIVIRNNLAVSLELAGKRAAALKVLETQTPYPDLMMTTAMVELKEGHAEKASEYLERTIKDKGRSAEGLLLLGILNLQRGDLKAAVGNFKEVISDDPENPEAYLNLGLTLRRQGRFTEAARIYARGIKARETADLHLNLGVLNELYLGNPDAALSHYRKFVELKGAGSDRVNGWINYLMSITPPQTAGGN